MSVRIRYDRRATSPLMRALEPRGPLRPLVEVAIGHETLDFQIREQGRFSMYHGSTQVVHGRVTNRGSPHRQDPKRDKAWLKGQASRKGFLELDPHIAEAWQPRWEQARPLDDLEAESKALSAYLARAIVATPPRYLRKEGPLQVALSQKPPPGLLVFDREAVLGYPSTQVRDEVLGEICGSISQAVPEFRPGGRPNEIDALALSSDGRRLFVIEAKDGSDEPGAGYTPAQVAMYLRQVKAWWSQAPQLAAQVVDGMVEQRQVLGLMPPHSRERVRSDVEIVPAIVIGGQVRDWAAVRSGMAEVGDRLSSSGEPLEGLRVWRWAAQTGFEESGP